MLFFASRKPSVSLDFQYTPELTLGPLAEEIFGSARRRRFHRPVLLLRAFYSLTDTVVAAFIQKRPQYRQNIMSTITAAFPSGKNRPTHVGMKRPELTFWSLL
jgi:hypothetical protein